MQQFSSRKISQFI